MGTGFNQVVSISGGPGTTSVQHIDYDPITHTLTLIKANGTSTQVVLKDSHVESITLNGNIMEFHVGDASHGLPDVTVQLDVSAFLNDKFATQVEVDAGISAVTKISPATLKQWLSNSVIATDATAANAGKLIPLNALGKIDAKYIEASVRLLEVGGKAFKPNAQYEAGDIVDNGNQIYTRKVAGGEATWDLTKWQIVDSSGRLHSDASRYLVGDIVSYGGKLYVNKTAITTARPWNPADWDLASAGAGAQAAEIGGVAYDTTGASIYRTGDVVGYAGSVYSALKPENIPGSFNPSEWKEVGSSEQGGVVWDSTTHYKERDVVSMPSTDKLYLALNDNIGSSPLSFIDWFEIHSIRYNAGTFAPSSSVGLPNTSSETEGAVWYIQGLPQTGYTYTSGPLNGLTAQNNDKIVWYGLDVNHNDVWLLEPFPMVHGEMGGLIYSSVFDYPVGAVCSFNDELYIALTDIPSAPASGPVANQAAWKHLDTSNKVTPQWLANISYTDGDLVMNNGELYTPASGPVPIGTTPPSTEWVLLTEHERGGIIYNPGSKYHIGDMVAFNGIGYICTSQATGAFNTTAWKKIVEDEVGGKLWNAQISYVIGDIVNRAGTNFIYRAFLDSVNQDPLTGIGWEEVHSVRYNAGVFTPAVGSEYPDLTTGGPLASGAHDEGAVWYIHQLPPVGYDMIATGTPTPPLTGQTIYNNDTFVYQGEDTNHDPIWLREPFPMVEGEKGGLAFSSARDYKSGTIVSDGQRAYMSLNDIAQSNTLPNTDPVNWKYLDTDAQVHMKYDPNAKYVDGDAVSFNNKIYLAPAAGIAPGITPPPSVPWVEIGGAKFATQAEVNAGISDVLSPSPMTLAGWRTYMTAIDPTAANAGKFVETDSHGKIDPKWVQGTGRWVSGTSYVIGDIVSYDGAYAVNLYIAKTASQGKQPDDIANAANWEDITIQLIHSNANIGGAGSKHVSNIVDISQVDYDLLDAAGTVNPDTTYMIF